MCAVLCGIVQFVYLMRFVAVCDPLDMCVCGLCVMYCVLLSVFVLLLCLCVCLNVFVNVVCDVLCDVVTLGCCCLSGLCV